MRSSIISNEEKCWVCRSTLNLHRHHIFEGRNRQNSDKYGLWVYLCAKHHNMSNEGIHFNKELNKKLKVLAQTKFEEKYSNLSFLDIFRRNYK